MIAQTLLVACLVTACTTYVVWTLMPASMRRMLALALLKLPLPRVVSAAMEKHSVASSGCACDGCDKSPAAAGASTATKPLSGGVAPILFHPRLRK